MNALWYTPIFLSAYDNKEIWMKNHLLYVYFKEYLENLGQYSKSVKGRFQYVRNQYVIKIY